MLEEAGPWDPASCISDIKFYQTGKFITAQVIGKLMTLQPQTQWDTAQQLRFTEHLVPVIPLTHIFYLLLKLLQLP